MDLVLVRLRIRMATRVSSSGGSIATVSPSQKRDLRTIFHPVDLFPETIEVESPAGCLEQA